MHSIKLKPMSVNEVWQGKRFKTKGYATFERVALLMLPPRIDLPEGDLRVYYEFGVSNRAADYDNPIKPFQDILQKKYGFNDSRITEAIIRKVVVKKGDEYIKFGLMSAND